MKHRRRPSPVYLAIWIAAGLLLAGMNGHLLYTALVSQPACVPTGPDLQPARRVC